MEKFTQTTIRVLQSGEAFVQKASRTAGKVKPRGLVRKLHPVSSGRLPLAVAVPLGLVSAPVAAFSLCLFHFMRTTEGIEAYYTDSSLSIVSGLFQSQRNLFFILLPLFLGLFLLSFKKRSLAARLTSLPLAFNMVVTLSMEHSDLKQIFLPSDPFLPRVVLNVTALLGFSVILTTIISFVFSAIDRKKDQPYDLTQTGIKPLVLFTVGFVIIALGWTPGIIMCYPGSLPQDTRWQIESYMGVIDRDASHPFLTTIYFGWLFERGRQYGNDNASLFKMIFIQGIVNASAMSLVCTRTYRYTRSKLFFILSVLYYAITPAWQIAAQNALKDVIHTGWYLLFYLEFMNSISSDETSGSEIAWLCFCALMVSFTRKATYYLVVLCIILLIVIKRKKRLKQYCACLAVIVVLFTACDKILYPLMNFKPPKERENYSLQSRQVALYCIEHGDEMTEDEIRIINGTLDFDKIIENYTPMISDKVKATFHGDAKAHEEFWALYYKLMLKHPLTFLKGMIMTSFEHLNPWYDDNFTNATAYISKNDSFHHIRFVNKAWKMRAYWAKWKEYPVARLMCGNGLSAWVLIVMLGYTIKTRTPLMLIGLSPHLFLLVGLFMSHVNGLIRYGYPLIAATPLIIAFTIFAAAPPEKSVPASAAPTPEEHTNLHPAHLNWLDTFGSDEDESGYYDK